MTDINLSKIEGNGYKSFYQLRTKRVIDILCCIIAMPIFLPVAAIISLLVKLDDGGPVLYRSRRIGKDFKEFDMFKFRSMKVNAPDLRNADGSTFNSSSDSRVTKIGKFLRETSLDELAQLLNVIKGDMSLIGPRAGDVESKDTYEIDEKDKTLVRPGISGYTQAYFRNNLDVRNKRLYDAWYAHNVTFMLDVRVLLKTIKTVLLRENIYTN